MREDVEAAHARQADVEQHDVERARLEPPQRFGPVGGLIDGVAGVVEQLGQDVTQRAIVVDDQDAPAGRRVRGHREPPEESGRRAAVE